jgi:hypothetical protein
MSTLHALLAALPTTEVVLAQGLANQVPVVITQTALVRSSQAEIVVIPFSSVDRCEYWHDTHRYGVRLFHSPIDPKRPPSDATQWWRVFDRRRYDKQSAQMWTQTELTFSSSRTAAAQALDSKLAEHRIARREIAFHREPQPNAKAALKRVR